MKVSKRIHHFNLKQQLLLLLLLGDCICGTVGHRGRNLALWYSFIVQNARSLWCCFKGASRPYYEDLNKLYLLSSCRLKCFTYWIKRLLLAHGVIANATRSSSYFFKANVFLRVQVLLVSGLCRPNRLTGVRSVWCKQFHTLWTSTMCRSVLPASSFLSSTYT